MNLPNAFRRIVLARRPEGKVCELDFRLETFAVPVLKDGEVLVANEFLSLDPYMRGRMNDARSYAVPQALGETMIGATAGTVLASAHPRFLLGERMCGMLGWCEGGAVGGDALRKITHPSLPSSAYLGALGMPGATAWYGLNQILQPQSGQTLLVSAAAGAVGGVVGQLAKLQGCRAVGIAGGEKKCRHVIENLGFDACVDYKQEGFKAALRAASPEGVDMLFENVGGAVFDAALSRMNAFGRIALCGMISGYEDVAPPIRNLRSVLINRLTMRGFIITEHLDYWPQAHAEIETLLDQGRLQVFDTVAQGLESAPQAFISMLSGGNLGKQLVRL